MGEDNELMLAPRTASSIAACTDSASWTNHGALGVGESLDGVAAAPPPLPLPTLDTDVLGTGEEIEHSSIRLAAADSVSSGGVGTGLAAK